MENKDENQNKKTESSTGGTESGEFGRRIPSPGRSFRLPGDVPASPPMFVSLEELMKAANGMTNMALAHEIAVNKDFTLEKLELPQNSIEKSVRDTIHKAFWDLLDSELKEDPPVYTQAFILLKDVKNGLLELLLPQHTKIKEQISDVLDIDLIEQQTSSGTLDFQHYSQYVLSVMSKLCAPIRDEKISQLQRMTDVTQVFKGILETIDLMKIDMANFTITMIRPQIIASSVEYERKKFADYLKLQVDGLAATKLWLGRHLTAAAGDGELRKKIENVLNDSYLELVEWKVENVFPETLAMDANRILDLSDQFNKLTLVGTILLLTYSCVGPDLSTVTEFRNLIKTNVTTLFENATGENMTNVLEHVGVKLTQDVVKSCEKYQPGADVDSIAATLREQVNGVAADDNKIRHLLRQRIKEFLLATITSRTAEPMKIPPGMSSLQQELVQLAGTFLRLISHNRDVFGEYYQEIITSGLQN